MFNFLKDFFWLKCEKSYYLHSCKLGVLMTRTYAIQGMTCNGCKATVVKQLSGVAAVTKVEVDLEKEIAVITSEDTISLKLLQKALSPKYSILENTIFVETTNTSLSEEKSKLAQLRPLFLVFAYIFLAAFLMNIKAWETRKFMLDFMGIFFFVFSFFKFLDLKGFAESFSMYDPLAREFSFYGKIYPFLELALGVMFFIRFEVEIALAVTICILGITTIGVLRVLVDKKKVQCACLGSVLKLPMTTATFIENAIMIVMALLMITSWV